MAFVVYNVDLNLGKVNIFLKKHTRKVITFCPDVSVVNIVGKRKPQRATGMILKALKDIPLKKN